MDSFWKWGILSCLHIVGLPVLCCAVWRSQSGIFGNVQLSHAYNHLRYLSRGSFVLSQTCCEENSGKCPEFFSFEVTVHMMGSSLCLSDNQQYSLHSSPALIKEQSPQDLPQFPSLNSYHFCRLGTRRGSSQVSSELFLVPLGSCPYWFPC